MGSPMFDVVPANEWRLIGQIDDLRRERLLTTPYEVIIGRLRQEASLSRCFPEKPRDGSEWPRRAVFRFKVASQTVDLFHNGAGGYRAQYYRSIISGEAANSAAIAALLPAATEAIIQSNEHAELFRGSVACADAKVWIAEWTWIDEVEPASQLWVAAWRTNCDTASDGRQQRSGRRGRLIPSDIDVLEVKGGWLKADLSPGSPFKPAQRRSADIHSFGFT